MMRFKAPLIILGLYLILLALAGCQTITGATKGVVEGAAKGGAEGFSKDWQNAKKADDWLRENLW